MKVILLKDVRKVGKKFEVRDVSDGYALNFLIPQKSAEVATEASLRRLETLKTRDQAEKKVHEDLLLKNLKDLDGKTIELVESANDKGSLFKGVHREEIVVAIKKETQIDMAPEYIMLEKPLKEVGEHTVEARVQDKTVKFKVNITAR